jgi:indole-3-pyruvate monooxygenase
MIYHKVVGALKEITETGAKFMDGNEERFDSVILATGYKSNVPSWLKVNSNAPKLLSLSIASF